jgi:SAM-dependent methyltransferase
MEYMRRNSQISKNWAMRVRSGEYFIYLLSPIVVETYRSRFGVESVERMVDWVLDNIPLATNPSVLEIGCGNGTLVLALFEAGYPATQLSGIDYSPSAIKLARSIAATRGEGITFNTCDFLEEDPPILSCMKEGAWDLLLDKGTFDAIALGEKDQSGRSPAVNYPVRVQRLLAPGGYFLITCTCMSNFCEYCDVIDSYFELACNFTEIELKAQFTSLVYQ